MGKLGGIYSVTNWFLFPCGPDKRPLTPTGYKSASKDPEQIATWKKGNPALWGIPCAPNGFFAVDIDPAGFEYWQQLIGKHGPFPYGPHHKTPRGGDHYLFKLPDFPLPGKLAEGIDLKCNGYICDGHGYSWEAGHDLKSPIPDAPAWLLNMIRPNQPRVDNHEYSTSTDEAASLLSRLSQYRCDAYQEWVSVGMALSELGDAGLTLWDQWSQKSQKYKPGETERKWKTFVPGQGLTLASLHYWADQDDPKKNLTVEEQPMNDEEVTERDPWQPYTLADAYADRKPDQYIVSGIRKSPSLNIVYGAPGDLKSLLEADMAVCIAAGMEFLPAAPWKLGAQSFNTLQCPALWLDFDNGLNETHDRFAALAKARNLPVDTPIFYLSMPDPWLDASKTDSINRVILTARMYGVKFIVIDNLLTVAGGIDENSSLMQPVMNNLKILMKETGACIDVIHHQRKSSGAGNMRKGDSLRGHSCIEAALTLALRVNREEGANVITLESTKTRGADVSKFAAAFTFEHKPGTHDLQEAKFYGVPIADDTSNTAIESTVLAVLSTGQMNKSTLQAAVKDKLQKAGVNRIRDEIERLAEIGRIAKKTGSNNTERIYSLC